MNKKLIIKELRKNGYRVELKKIDSLDNENKQEYFIISNSVSSCAIQFENDTISLYEIGYDFNLKKYLLYFRKENIININETLLNIEFLIGEISKEYIINNINYFIKENSLSKLNEIKEVLINNKFNIIEIEKNNTNYILISKDNVKWISINYKHNEYIYNYVYKSPNLSMDSIYSEKIFDIDKVKKLIINNYDDKIYSF